MPPKGKNASHQNASQHKADSKFDYPVNECRMAIQLDVTHEGAHNFKIKFDWLS